MQLPPDLLDALEEALESHPRRYLTATVQELSLRYRETEGSVAPLLQSELDVAAYVAFRLPATYAAIAAVMREVRERQPDLEPRSMLDLGGGPGTAAWAAVETWPSIETVTVVERDPHMIRMGESLAEGSGSPVLRTVRWVQADLLGEWPEQADLTVGGYMLGELPRDDRPEFVRRFWEHTGQTAILVEPGTPRGWEIARAAGQSLSDMGAAIIAPFPWTWTCVEGEDDWAHFAERVPRTRIHRLAKEAELAYEDEKYTYVAASRLPATPIAARVMRHPQVRKGHIRLTLCTPEGIRHAVVARSDREAYRRAKRLEWGSAIVSPGEVP